MPSEVEVRNATKVRDMLGLMDGISFETVREDIFSVTELETGANLSLTVDVEETTVCLIMDIANRGELVSDAFEQMLLVNNRAVHGKFCLDGDRVLFKDNLEFENLDFNELEASMAHMFLVVAQNIESILELATEDA